MDLDKKKISFGLKPSYFFDEDLQDDEGSGSDPEDGENEEVDDEDEEMQRLDSDAESVDEEVNLKDFQSQD